LKQSYSFPRYLAAKRTVDDRALNQQVWRSLAETLAGGERPWRVLEIGAGTGTMFQRMVEWGGLRHAEYTAIDALPENIACAAQSLIEWAPARGLILSQEEDRLVFNGTEQALNLRLEAVDLFDYLKRPGQAGSWDLIVAHAFLDLIDLPAVLPDLARLLAPGGRMYLTINFDGLTVMEPPVNPGLDDRIMTLYHRTMDERRVNGRRSGDSKTGRRMFHWLHEAGLEILAAGSSDWTVFARQGVYPDEEAYFLHFILHFFAEALTGHPELAGEPFADWLAARHEQVERGELVYIAHQMDFLAALPG
jgi:SAM-dependent methyltransferase